jgi:nitroreductase
VTTTIPGALGLSPEQVTELLTAAGRAPSLHNSQPWRFRVAPHVIELYADPERRLPVVDPDGREQRVACGAALFNLRLALHGFGVRPLVGVLPDPERPDLVAEVRHGGEQATTPEERRLLAAIPQRRTNRHPFSDVVPSTPERHDLQRAAAEEGAWLHVVDDRAQRRELQRIAARAHGVQAADAQLREETARWTAVGPDRPDGVPASAGGPLPEPQDRWVLRDFTAGTGRVRAPGKDFEDEPLIAVLSTHLTGPHADVQAGQAIERVLLTATAAGLAVSLLSHVVEVPSTREELRDLVGGDRPPQAVLRIGRGWPVPLTPRRPPGDLVVTEAVR